MLVLVTCLLHRTGWVKRRQKVEKMEREQELELLVDGTIGALERQAQRAPISMVGHRPAE